jgi:WD40 repeat protein
VSAGWDGNIFVWKLKNNGAPDKEFNRKGTNFSSVVRVTETNAIFAVGTDKSIKEINNGKEMTRFEGGQNIS